MGTRGYRAWRHKKRYFVYYNHSDSYPQGLGLEVLGTVPKDPEQFRLWLEEQRAHFDLVLEKSEQGSNHDEVTIQDDPPKHSLSIEWIYTIDLDRLIFHVDSRPLFNLKHLPDPDVFLESIGLDHYGHRACTAETPAEYRCCWKVTPAVVEDKDLAVYKASSNPSERSHSISGLLGLSEQLAMGEVIRERFLESLVGQFLRNDVHGRFRELDTYDQLIPSTSPFAMRRASALVDFCLGPMIYAAPYIAPTERGNIQWPRKDTVVVVHAHLDDERSLQAGISRLVDAVFSKSGKLGRHKFIYGMVFSVLHCSIVKVDMETRSIAHTPVLQFLPTLYAASPSTPGITALARLGFLNDPDVLTTVTHRLRVGWGCYGHPWIQDLSIPSTASGKPGSICSALPQEIYEAITDHIYSPFDLVAFACLSKPAADAAADKLRIPHVISRHNPYRITDAKPFTSLGKRREGLEYSSLCCAKFSLAGDKGMIDLWMGGTPGKLKDRRCVAILRGYAFKIVETDLPGETVGI